MFTRKTFLQKGAAAVLAAAIPGCAKDHALKAQRAMKTSRPRTALCLWYSQTGHTERNGRIIAKVLEKAGLKVKAMDLRECDAASLGSFDLIIVGTPVYYLDVPENVGNWLKKICRIDGIPVAAYSTFGGPGDNQYNTAFYLLGFLADKGGVPAGIGTFGNMSTFAPTWSMGNEKRILKYRDRPNEEIYRRVRLFAADVLAAVRRGEARAFDKKFHAGDFLRGAFLVKINKAITGRHTIDKNKCIRCGRCMEKCPVEAIDVTAYSVDQEKCIACMGCVNNCPVQAVDMVFMGKKVYGFREFLKKNHIRIQEPPELL